MDAIRHLQPDEYRAIRAEEVPDGARVVGGYGLRFETPHVDGYHFDTSVDLGPGDGDNRDVSFNHHIPVRLGDDQALSEQAQRELADHRFLPARATRDELGVWIEAVLREADEYEQMVDELVRAGKLGWSPASAPHTARVRNDGVDLWWQESQPGPIVRFPVVEWALTPRPADPQARAVSVRSMVEPYQPTPAPSTQQATAMKEENTQPDTDAIRAAVAEAMAAQQAEAARAAAVEAETARQAAAQEELEALRAQVAAQPAQRSTTDWGGTAPAITDSTFRAYDNNSLGELALVVAFCAEGERSGMKRNGRPAQRASGAAYNTLARRLMDSEESNKNGNYLAARQALRMMAGGMLPGEDGKWHRRHAPVDLAGALRANEIHQSTLANGVDEWIGVAYSGDLWDVIRLRANVVGMMDNQEFPAGAESLIVPVLDGDVTFYKVAQSASLSANPGGIPTNTVTSSTLNSGNVTVTLAKHGARSLWAGEVSEDAVLPFVATLRNNFAESGADHLESAIIDGDTSATTNTNINDAATLSTSTDYFLAYNGLRHLGLSTNTANSRDGGVLAVEDFLQTVQLMGTAGIDGIDRNQVCFLVDPSTHYKALQLTEVKTQDVFSNPTVEGGLLTRIWGYPVYVTGNICKMSTSRLSNSSGWVDQGTQGNNTKGQIVSFRKDHWRFYWRRRISMETTRIAAADATEIVALMRTALTARDNEAAAITYNLTV